MAKANAYIIDDDPVVVEILQAMLLRKAFSVTTFREGATALQALQQVSAPENFPNIILLDFMLENETGLEVLAQIRNLPGGQSISVIMLSSNSPDEIATSAATKPNAFLQKPFTAADLDTVLSSL